MSEFAASHAGGVEHHQCPSKQCSSRINQARSFLPAQHSWQPTTILGVRKEITELMTLERLDKKKRSAATRLTTVSGVSISRFGG